MRRLALPLLASLALLLPGSALAQGGHYAFQGGSAYEQSQVKQALAVSAFDFSLVPQTITVVIGRGLPAEAWPGTIQLDADLLDAGDFSWGVVQHEYAHQVDFALLTDATHQALLPLLGGSSWFDAPQHSDNAGERFASTLAWAYWPSPDNCMQPQAVGDESAAMDPLAFRTLLRQTLIGLGVQGADALPVTLGPTHGIGSAVSKTVVAKPGQAGKAGKPGQRVKKAQPKRKPRH